MKYKNAAGLYVGGISLILAGPLIVFIAITFRARVAFSNPSTELTGLFLGLGIFGALLGLVGFVLLVGAGYRALVTIDAVHVELLSADRESRSTNRR